LIRRGRRFFNAATGRVHPCSRRVYGATTRARPPLAAIPLAFSVAAYIAHSFL
jgi:hypothetical protein